MDFEEHTFAHAISVVDPRQAEPPGDLPAWQRFGEAPRSASHRRYALRQSLVRLADASGDPGLTEAMSIEAGEAAAALAEVGDGDGLARVLRPDPAAELAAWTVACYEIGHLTPSALRDLSDPCDAVNLVGACPEPSHVAAELVVSTTTGLQWTVLVRAGGTLRLMLPRPESRTGSEEITAETAELARRRWSEELERWRAEPEPTDLPPPEVQSAQVIAAVAAALERASILHAAELEALAIRHAAEMEMAALVGRSPATPDLEVRFAGVLDNIEHRLRRIEDRLRTIHPDASSRPPAAICRKPT